MQVHSNPVLSSQSPYSVQSEPSVLLVRPNTSSSVSFVVTANDSNVGGPPSEALQGTLTALDLDRSGVSLAYNSSGQGQLAFYLLFLVYVCSLSALPSLFVAPCKSLVCYTPLLPHTSLVPHAPLCSPSTHTCLLQPLHVIYMPFPPTPPLP